MNSPQLLKEIGKQIAIIRNRANLSQFGLNRMCGLPEGKNAQESHIAKLERGELNITLETLALIAAKCECHIDIKLRSNRRAKSVPVTEEDLNTPAAIVHLRNARKVV